MEFFNYLIDKSDFIINFLLKQTIYTCILFIIIFVISLLPKKKSPHWHFGLWLLIFVRLLLPTDLSFSISARSVLEHIPLVNSIAASIENISNDPSDGKDQHITGTDEITTTEQKHTSASNAYYYVKSLSMQPIFVFLWLAGCLLIVVLVLKKLRRFHSIIKKSDFIENDKLTTFLTYWQHQLKIKRTVKIVTSDKFLSPFTTGIFRPLIFIPNTILNSSDTDTVHSIIAHELVHIKHFDALWMMLQNILQIFYFFNPVVWYAGRQISLTREQICDSTVITSKIITPKIYGNSILQILKLNLFGFDLAELSPGFGSHKRIFKKRIQNITKENTMKKPKTFFIVMAICLIGFFVLPLAGKTDAVKNDNIPASTMVVEKAVKLFMVAQNAKATGNFNIAGNDEIKFTIPMDGPITSLFGWRKDPFTEERYFHTGIDIAAPQGTSIKASASGVVIEAKFKPEWGNTIVIQHTNDYSTTYGQCDTILVKKGQTVKSGDTIATCGMSGRATGPHLHFEIKKDGTEIDPYSYLYGEKSASKKSYRLFIHLLAEHKKNKNEK